MGWIGIGAKLVVQFIQIVAGIHTAHANHMSLPMLTLDGSLQTVTAQLRTERSHDSPLQGKDIRPDGHADQTAHTLAPSHACAATSPLTGSLPRRVAARRSESP
jgi:hypothetical protein